MILKIISIVMVIASSTTIGLYYGNLDSNRVSNLLEIKKALIILKQEINFSLNTLPQSFENISQKIKKPIKDIFIKLYKINYEEDERSLSEIWNETIKLEKEKIYLNNEDIEMLISFGNTLGYLDKDMQIITIDNLILYIDSKVEVLENTKIQNKKIYSSLGMMIGLAIVIIFI